MHDFDLGSAKKLRSPLWAPLEGAEPQGFYLSESPDAELKINEDFFFWEILFVPVGRHVVVERGLGNSFQLHSSWLMGVELKKNQKKPHISGVGDGGRDRENFFFFAGGLADIVSFRPSKKEAEGAASQEGVQAFFIHRGETRAEHPVLGKLRTGSPAV